MEAYDVLAVCHRSGLWGELLKYALYFPLLLLATIFTLHLVVWDVVSLAVSLLTLSVFWIPVAVVWAVFAVERPNASDDVCAARGFLQQTEMPDPWQVTTASYVLMWTLLLVWRPHLRRRLQTPVVVLWAGLLLFEAALLVNRYASWASVGVSMAVAVGLTVPTTWLLHAVLLPNRGELVGSWVGRRAGIVSVLLDDKG